ncbi:protein phosphatase 1 regulatory subunit 1B isoform X1 [Pygocentrus nattereri]|uniref:Protein phosphatase 1 regulatory subunit 1B n=1 Tax=Pygocentrus nattereri TaxID=42514 RepID=A0AAR2KQY0_PYGNA|nr:protein phosphatase 1 regulatory subunit 1B isoform X1 [Pygocentrus nattereri]
MDTSGPEDVPVEPKERKKIQFAVPSTAPTQLDPRQVEMIRRRRPTPATLFRVADQTSPEDDNSTHQWVVGENGVLKPKRVNPSVYQPPSLKAVQQMAEAQMQKLGVYPHMEEEGEEPLETEEAELLRCTADSQGEGVRDDRPESSKLMTTERTEEEDEEEEEEEKEEETTEDESRNVE